MQTNAQIGEAIPIDLNRIQRATVLVMQLQTTPDGQFVTCASSGTLVSRDGLVLTNAHSTVPNANCAGDTLLVALDARQDAPPVLSYQARVIQSDLGLDLALLQISAELNGRPITPDSLSLPFVDLAQGASVSLDDTILVVGYPGLGDDPVALVTATISGFTAEPRGGDRAWLKFRTVDEAIAEIPGTFSGGGAYNREGQLIGIPTTAPIAQLPDSVDCARFQDTNRDNLINNGDACVPLGGAINALRPTDFALPLIRSASLNLEVTAPQPTAQLASLGTQPTISNVFFAPSVNNDMPTTVISSLPAGANSLFLFFDYAAMTPETIYELRVAIDGSTSPIFSLPPVRWSGGSRGLWYIGLTGQTLPNGEYAIRLFIDGILAAEAPPLRVGGAPEPLPAFRNVQFVLIENDQMFGNGYILGAGTTVSAQFIYDGMTDGLEWTGIWYFNGQELSPRVGGVWDLGANGAQTSSLSDPNGLIPGRYRLALYIEGRLSALSDFTIAGSRADVRPRVFSNERFVVADTPTEAATRFPTVNVTIPPTSIYAMFDWELIAPGTIWHIRVLVDGDVFYERVEAWQLTQDGAGYALRIANPDGQLPDGTYRFELLMNNILLRTASIAIGIGQLPIDPFARPEGVLVRGQLIDGDLSEEFSVIDFNATQAQLYTQTTTDRNGRFQFSQPLRFAAPYSLIIAAD
ncbi:MAG: serine protease, partial [Anaerolineae bacterium]|nr:serine protease [Anaerolineae bacterium]